MQAESQKHVHEFYMNLISGNNQKCSESEIILKMTENVKSPIVGIS